MVAGLGHQEAEEEDAVHTHTADEGLRSIASDDFAGNGN